MALATGEARVIDLLQAQPASAWTVTNPAAPWDGQANPLVQSVADTGTPAGPGVRSDAVGVTDMTCDIATVDRTFTLPAMRAASGGTLSLYYNTGVSGELSATSITVVLLLNGKKAGHRSYGVRVPYQGTPLDEEIPAGQVSTLDLGAIPGASLFDQVRILLNHYAGSGTNFNEVSDLTLDTDPEEAQTASQHVQGLIDLIDGLPNGIDQTGAMRTALRDMKTQVLNGESAFQAGGYAAAIRAFDAAKTPFADFKALLAQKEAKIIRKAGQAYDDAIHLAVTQTDAALGMARLRAVQQDAILAMQEDLAQALARLRQAFPDSPDEVAWRQDIMQATGARAEDTLVVLGTDEVRIGLIRKGAQTQFDFYITTWQPRFQFAFHAEEDFLNDAGSLGGSRLFEAPFYISIDPGLPYPALDVLAEGTRTPNSVRLGDTLFLHFNTLRGSVFVDALNCGPDDLLLLSLTLTDPDGRTCTRALLVALDNP